MSAGIRAALLRVSLILLWVCGPSSTATAEVTQVARVKDGVALEGSLTSQAVDRAIQLMRPQDTLFVSSRDGDVAATLRLVRELQRMNVPIAVNGECVGLCANYIFLLAPRRRAEIGGSVRFTPTNVFDPKPSQGAAINMGEYYLIAKRSGIPNAFIDCLKRALVGQGAYRPQSVAVSPIVLKHFGIQFGGKYNWPTDPSDRRGYAADIDPSMTWLDDPATCRAIGSRLDIEAGSEKRPSGARAG